MVLNWMLALGTFNVHSSLITSFKSKCTLRDILQQYLLRPLFCSRVIAVQVCPPWQLLRSTRQPLNTRYYESIGKMALKRNHETKDLPDICRRGRLPSPTNRPLFLCPRLPTAHRAPPSLCSRRRCAIASDRPRGVDSGSCGL